MVWQCSINSLPDFTYHDLTWISDKKLQTLNSLKLNALVQIYNPERYLREIIGIFVNHYTHGLNYSIMSKVGMDLPTDRRHNLSQSFNRKQEVQTDLSQVDTGDCYYH